jgi:hypothetical protein
LATRLQTDDPGRQANWADIDDDDDDWAPESIEWTDGTKITLPQADEAPPPAPEPVPTPTLKDTRTVEPAKPKSPAPPQPSASPIVRPSGFGSGRAGLVLKGASEKPTLVAKPPGPPTPVKSPWAPLPPVDKVAPVAIEIPENQLPSQSRFGQRDPHGFHGMPPPPAKEIAADDFSRSWREGNSTTSRELYNSQSGRYEPVNDNRRGSMRNDAHSRQPALLQRPSQQDGPAEPSPAFQTHRAGGQDAAYGRRRTSSNVSGGSGNFATRMSRGHDMPPPHEMLNTRRGSLAAVSDAPSSPRNFSPSGQHPNQRGYQNQQWQQSRASPVISHPSPQSVHNQTLPLASVSTENQNQPTSAVLEDPIEAQKKIMRQTRELAIKRRQEEEAREEAARKERIRIKLEAMGPPPETKKNKKDTPKEEKSVPTQIQTRGPGDTVSAQSQPSVPEIRGDSKMKSSEQVEELASSMSTVDTEKRPPNQDFRPNGVHHGGNAPSTAAIQHAAQDPRPSQSWQNNQAPTSDTFHSWGAAPAQQPMSRNVWGPPSNDRTLGNGTFNPELSRLPEIHPSSNPGPIGPPNRGHGQYQQGHGREPYNSRPAPIGPPNRQQGLSRQDQQRGAVANSGWGSLPERLAQEDAQLHQQQELELARRRELQEAGLAPEIPQPIIKDTWRQVSLNDDGTRSKIQASSTTINDVSSQGNSSWKAYPEKGPEEATTRAIFEEQENVRRHPLDSMGNQSQQFNETWRSASNMNASPPVRGSRFFPVNRDVRLEDSNASFDRPGSPSPPPPTMAGHPAYDGDSAHPHVSLPRPTAVVRLPPVVLAPIGPPKSASFATAVTAPPAPPTNGNSAYSGRQDYIARNPSSYQDVRISQEHPPSNWQERINSLVGRRNSPPKPQDLAVDSSSKHALELPMSQMAATVSLPSSVSGDLSIEDGAVVSKPAAEECFEEQEMGSLPVIKVPAQAPPTAWTLAANQPKTLPKKFVVSHVTTVEPISFFSNGNTITIMFPGQEELKSVTIPASHQRSNPRRGGSRGGTPRHTSSTHPRGGRGRDTSSGFPSPSLDNASVSPSPNSSSRGGHRGGRGYGSNWNRHVSTPVHT